MRTLADVLRRTALLQPKARTTKQRDRLAEKASAITRRYAEALSKATSAEQHAAIDEAHRQCSRRIEHHRHSFFGPAPAQRISRSQADQVMAHFYDVRDEMWRKRLKGQQRVPDSRRRVLRFLLDQAVKFGVVDVAVRTIADNAGCCMRTVRNCLNWLRAAKLLGWRRRIRWATNALGVAEPRQLPNGYMLAPAGLAAIGLELLDKLRNLGSGTAGKKCSVAKTPPEFPSQANAPGLRPHGAG
jgi:hypothetical protein